jgi:hypothetical protein
MQLQTIAKNLLEYFFAILRRIPPRPGIEYSDCARSTISQES